jgi:hypothetical protein
MKDTYLRGVLLTGLAKATLESADLEQALEHASSIPDPITRCGTLAELSITAASMPEPGDTWSRRYHDAGLRAAEPLDEGIYGVRALGRLGQFVRAKEMIDRIGTLDERVMASTEPLGEIAETAIRRASAATRG